MINALSLSNKPDLKKLESKLKSQKDEVQRIVTLDKMIDHLAYTDVKKAQELLAEQKRILNSFSHPDFLLKYHLNSSFVENQLYNFKLARIHLKDAIEILEDRGNVKEQAEALIDLVGILINLEEKDEANRILEKASDLLEMFPDSQLEARVKCREGYIHLNYANYTKAIELFLDSENRINALAKDKVLEMKDYYFLTLIHSGLGKIYQANEEMEKCIQENLRVIEMCESLEMRSRLSWHYLFLGNAYMSESDFESAEVYFKKAIAIEDDISQYARAGAMGGLGFCLYKKGKYNQALDQYNQAENLYRTVSNEDYINFSIIESWRAKLFLALGKDGKAKRALISSFEHAERKGDFHQLAIVCKEIAAYYAQKEDFKNAYEYQTHAEKMQEKYYAEVNSQMLYELEVKYESEKKRQEAKMLRLEATELQLKALRAQMNPHFMYNALNSIQSFITSNKQDIAAKYLAKFAKLMRQSLDYSDMKSIALEEEIEFLEDYLYINQQLRFDDNLTYKIIVDEELEEDIMGVPTMIVQPYVENAIEHGLRTIKNGLVKIEFLQVKEDEQTILCVVEDNGVGREKVAEAQKNGYNNQYESKGTSITEKRLEILNKSDHKGVFVNTIDLKDKKTGKPTGTRVEILIPVVNLQLK